MSETNLDPRDRLAVMVSMAGSYIESGRGDDALAVMRTVAEDVATEIARLARELEEARERERALRDDLTEAIGHLAALVDLYRDGYPESDHAARLVSAAETYLESPSREQDVPSALSTLQEVNDV